MKMCPWQQRYLAPVNKQVPRIVCSVIGKDPWKHLMDVAHVQTPDSLSRCSGESQQQADQGPYSRTSYDIS